MKNFLFTLILFGCFDSVKAQSGNDASILESLVRKTHSALRDVATRSGVPYTVSAHWPERVYLQKADSMVYIPFDSLRTGWSHLDYDIVVAFDLPNLSQVQFLQGAIILKPVDRERAEKLRSRIMYDKRIYEERRSPKHTDKK